MKIEAAKLCIAAVCDVMCRVMHSVQKKLVTDSKHRILIELANNSKQRPLHPDMTSLFVVNIQETVFNYVCGHLEMSRKMGQFGRNCTRYSKISSPIDDSNSLL